MRDYVITYSDNKSDVADDVVNIVTAQTYFGSDWGASMVFFLKVDPPANWDDISVMSRLSDIKSIREQY